MAIGFNEDEKVVLVKKGDKNALVFEKLEPSFKP
jgi:hypothetical protein